MAEIADRLIPIAQAPLGAHWDGRGVSFAVFSEGAEKIELCLFGGAGGRSETRLAMPECIDGVWQGYLPNAGPGQLYGYRAYGAYEPRQGRRYNGHKLLLDPYARDLAGDLRWHDALHGYRIGARSADLSFDRRDSAQYLPKAVVVADRFDWENDRAPRVPWADTVIYELHVKGFTKRVDGIPEHDRGTFGALGHPHTIDYLRRLGVTAVELLPIHAFARDRLLLDRGLTNYWGYNTLSYFAPERAYLSDGTLGQIKWAVRQLHRAGIEVILDVVYNHTCEGSELGPTLSWRGFGESEYYRLLPDNPRHHINETGCGNTLDFSHRRVIQMTLDSLRWWAAEFHVDGFRFDLGVTLGREPGGFDPGSGFFDALLQDPLLAPLKLISEPWDVGPGGYQVGNHPAGISEWNDRFRDDVRRYWKGDAGLRASLAGRLQGSAELFDHHRRRPWASINFVTAHDGFTLHDTVSYNDKHNEANGEDGRDGSDHNASCNWGAEGPSADPQIVAQRERIKRALLATLVFAQGTPMLLAGDEFGQTQHGNNNGYCQDNEICWLDWRLPRSAAGAGLRAFTERLLQLRRECAVLQAHRFLHARVEIAPGLRDMHWFDERGGELSEDDWHNPEARLLGVRRAALREDGAVDVAVLLLNADPEPYAFRLPQPRLAFTVRVDTDEPQRADVALADGHCRVAGHSLVLLTARPALAEIPLPEVESSEAPVESSGGEMETEVETLDRPVEFAAEHGAGAPPGAEAS